MKEKNLIKLVGLAVNDYEMIGDGQKILICLSGGEDSTALLYLLSKRLRQIPVSYELIPVFVDIFNGQYEERNQEIELLKNFVKNEFGLELEVLYFDLFEDLKKTKKRNYCFRCAYSRRKHLIRYAISHQIQKIAFGHHKDDIVETIMMNMLFKKETSAMLPRLELFGGQVDIIRPMAYLSKSQIHHYIEEKKPPVLKERCPVKMDKGNLRREQVRSFIDLFSKEYPDFKNNIFASFRNPRFDYFLNHDFNPKTASRNKRP